MPKLWHKNKRSSEAKPPCEEKVRVENKHSVAYRAPQVNTAFEDDNTDVNGAGVSSDTHPDTKNEGISTGAGDDETSSGKDVIALPLINVAPSSPSPLTGKLSDKSFSFEENLAAEVAIKRRHSDFGVISSPRPVNEDLALEDLKRRGSPDTERRGGHLLDGKQGTRRKKENSFIRSLIVCLFIYPIYTIGKRSPEKHRHSIDTPRGRGPQWSPRLARKRIEERNQTDGEGERRKTLAELAAEAGYKVSNVCGHNILF